MFPVCTNERRFFTKFYCRLRHLNIVNSSSFVDFFLNIGMHNLEESLREVACLGDLQKLKMLIGAGANLNSQNLVNGWTALHWAAKRNHVDIVSFLLDCGASSSIASYNGEMPANVSTSREIKELLLKDKQSTENDNFDKGTAKF